MNKNYVNLTATQRLVELLSNINHSISYKLVECIRYKINAPVSFLDFGDMNDSISFIHSTKVWELMNEVGDEYKMKAWTSKRSSMKIGKLIKLLFADTYPINIPKGVNAPKPPVDIESFVNMFKAERDKSKNYEKFEIVKGRDIRFWYNQANYSRFIQEDTTLGKSCLRYEESGKLLEMYVSNPDVVNMLILKDDVDRLRGRALVWNLTYPEGRIYMERIYTINDFDVEIYKNYAREQGWLFKSRQTYGYNHNIIDGRTNEELNWEHFPMRVQLKNRSYKFYPYLDTLSVYNTDTHVLSNEHKLLRKAPHIRLTDSQGRFIDEVDYREMVYSRIYNDEIPREEAIYAEFDEDWVYQHDAVYVHNCGGKKAYKENPAICYSNIMGKEKYFLKEMCVYSDYLGCYVYKESSREAYIDDTKTKKIIIHRRMIDKYFEIKNGEIFAKKKDDFKKSSFEKKIIKRKEEDTDWSIPVDNTDTEEIVQRREEIRFSDIYSHSIEDEPINIVSPRFSTSARRRETNAVTRATNDELLQGHPVSQAIDGTTDPTIFNIEAASNVQDITGITRTPNATWYDIRPYHGHSYYGVDIIEQELQHLRDQISQQDHSESDNDTPRMDEPQDDVTERVSRPRRRRSNNLDI